MVTIRRRCPVLAFAVALFLLACGGGSGAVGVEGETARSAPAEGRLTGEPGPADADANGRGEEQAGENQVSGPGFVVWESNRSGDWRVWIRKLAGGPPRRLSPEEPGRTHCCPHISPDGRQIAYLSGRGGEDAYPPEGLLGALHLIAPDGSGDRAVAPAARSYFENRAVVWRSAGELIHIDGEGATVLLDLARGASRRLADPPAAAGGWLIDRTLSWATTGLPGFAHYDAKRRVVAPRGRLGGCQPYFSADGRWGFWAAGAGGPIDRLELAADRRGRILDKNDPRLPDGFGYAYFPMLSADGRLFAWAASRGGHDHFQTDYEIFVAESDPDTLELIGAPRRLTHDPGTDRFPDVWQPPLALGRHAGEVPLTVRLSAPEPGDWRWRLGDGGEARGPRVEHSWAEPGRYELVAQRGEETLRGLVVARPAAPPRALSATARAGGKELVVAFDEEIDVSAARVVLASGGEVAGLAAAADGRGLRVRLASALREPDRLTLSGVADRAQQPNVLAPTTLEVEPPSWPASRDGLVFVWETADAANLVLDRELGAERAYTLTASGRARLDAEFRMVADGGAFSLAAAEADRLRAALQATNELSLELTIVAGGEDGRIVTWAGDKEINLWLERRSGRLVFGLRTDSRSAEAYPRVELFDLPAAAAAHLVLTYEPGRLAAYLDGELRFESAELQGDLYHWRDPPLSFGGDGWRGRIEGVAIYDRVLGAAEVAEARRLYLAKREARPPIPRSTIEVRLVARSRPPTLAEISPYREALLTVDYAVEAILDGPFTGTGLRGVEWAILDGADQPVTRAAAGERFRLTIEPFSSQPQLESVYLAETLGGRPERLYYVVDAAGAR